jgi:phosphoenolpyruvate-protein phosphotransferase
MPISPGIALGPARLYRAPAPIIRATKIDPTRIEEELHSLQTAISAAREELQALQAYVAKTVGSYEAAIFEAQHLMLEDPDLVEEARGAISTHLFSAGAALVQVSEDLAREFETLANETLATRAADVRDVTTRVLRHLYADDQTGTVRNDETPVLVVAYDLTPSDTATLDPDKILGICTVVGGPTTHAAILARALSIPAVCGIDAPLLESVSEGQHLAIDGTQGLLYIQFDPLQEQILRAEMEHQREERARSRKHEMLWHTRPGETSDGVPVQIFANVGDVESACSAAELGAEGIGLLRTEFLFGGREVFPNEQEQFERYIELFQVFGERVTLGKTIIARTLDAGADKPFPALEPLVGSLQEANPALGLRGARIHLVHEELLRQQLRALLRAGAATGIHLHIMFPMIATLEEVRRLRAIYDSTSLELEQQGVACSTQVRMGIMVETPAAALMADVLAREVEFMSIGANDLSQYTMAADRTNSRVTSMFGVLEPAVWRLIACVVQAGATHGKMVSVCGELAADPRIGPALTGLGVKELSMNPLSIGRVKAALHSHPMEYWQSLAKELLKAETAADVQRLLQG